LEFHKGLVAENDADEEDFDDFDEFDEEDEELEMPVRPYDEELDKVEEEAKSI